MTNQTETTKPEACAEAGGQVERVVSHRANEWADCSTNGLQLLKNVRDGLSTLDEAIASMEENITYCRQVKEFFLCDIGGGEIDHIGGTADCSAWHCSVCGAVDSDRAPPTFDDDVLYRG